MDIYDLLEKSGLDVSLINQITALISERMTDIGKQVAKRKRDDAELIYEGQLKLMEDQFMEGFLDNMAWTQSHECELFYHHGFIDGVKLVKAIMSM